MKLRLISSETPGRGLAFWIVAFSVFVIVTIVLHALWFYQRQRDYAIERALTDAQNLASTLEEHTRSTIQWTGLSLESLCRKIDALVAQGHPTIAELRAAVTMADQETPDSASFVYADATGLVIQDKPATIGPPVTIAGTPYFEAAKASKDVSFHLIAPRWPANGAKLLIGLVRPVHRADGAFAGVVIGTVDPSYFRQIHTRLDLGSNSTIAVFSRDGIMVARAPHREDFIGTSFADNPVFKELDQSRLFGSHYNWRTRDGRARFVAYRAMPDMPFVVVVGRAEDEVLRPLRDSGRVALSYVAALVTTIGMFAGLILVLARKQDRAHRHLRATLDNINQGIIVFDKDLRLMRCNKRYVTGMFDLPSDLIKPGLDYRDLLRYLAERGEYLGQTAEEVIKSRLENGTGIDHEQRVVHTRPNGNVVIIYRKPMAGGGFVITFTDITEEVRIKAESEAQSRLLQLVLGSVGQGIRVFDKDMKVVLANRRVVEDFGYPEDFARIGASYESTVRISAESGEYGKGDVDAMVSERLALGKAGVSRGSIRRTPNGCYVKKQRNPIPGGGFVTTYTDVTELVRAEAELAQKSALLKLTQEHMGDGISVFDERLQLINFNKRWTEIWDVPPELARIGASYLDILGHNVSRGLHGPVTDLDEFVAKRVEVMLNEKFTSLKVARPDGSTILVRRYAAPNGIVVISHTDITRLKQAEIEAARKSTVLEAVLEHMAQGILVCDANMRIIALNEKFSELQGYRPGDLHLGMPYEDVLRLAVGLGNIETDDLESLITDRLRLVAARESYRKEYQAHSGRHITLRHTPMPDGGFIAMLVDITERKKAEMALQTSEERYRTLVMSAAQLIWSTDSEGSVIEPQPTWQGFPGQTDDDVMGSGWTRAFHPEDISYVRRNWLIALEAKTPCLCESRLRRHDGVYRTFSLRVVPVFDHDGGKLREWVGICEDISERKQAETAMAAKSALFEATLENMAQGVTVYDSDLKLVAYNQRYIDLFEFPPGFIVLGKSREDCLRFLANRGDFGSDAEEQLRQRLTTGRNKVSHQREFVQANGRTLFVSHTAMPSGGFINTFTDISDRKQAEQALRESEERLRAILENIADAIITTDQSGAIQSYNAAAARIFGYGARDVIGMNIGTLIPGPRFQTSDHLSADGNTGTMARHRDGAMFPIDLAVTSAEMPGHGLQIAIVRDIGEQVALQAQLSQASTLATLGEMAAAMAHEMNQPLNVMRMAAENGLAHMDRGLATEAYLRETLSIIAAQAERLGKLVVHMRVFSRSDPAEFEPLDPRASVTGAVELMGQRLSSHNIELTVALPEACRPVMGLPLQLEHVVINLLSNAQDAILAHPRTGSGAAIGAIAIAVIDETDADMVRIKVADTGGGIPSEIMNRIFEPFFTTKETGKGIGLGLSVSYGFVTAMNGKINVASSSEGSEFTILLPVQKVKRKRGKTRPGATRA